LDPTSVITEKENKMKKRLVPVLLVLIVTLLVAMSVQASTPQEFYLEKTCQAETYCDIHDAEGPFKVLNGGRIYYFDHNYFENPAGIAKETSRVLLISGDGKHSLTGFVSWVWRDAFKGTYTIVSGTGDLVGVHAVGKVYLLDDENWTFSLTGTYHVEP
jgi:hypothetical protein